MADKHTIIDGVDISKYKHYDDVFNYCDQSYLGEGGLLKNTKNPRRCEYSPNYYYKQLKRKEQECEELKVWKKEHLKDVEFIERNPLIDILNSMADNILLVQRNEKLKQTIIEIKEIAIHCIKQDICTTCDNSDKCHIEDEEIPTYDVCKLILQKISEVEDE